MLGDAVISDWCASAFGERMARVMFRTGHLAQVVGTELADGRQVVIKVRPFERRVAGCVAVQAHLAKSGFPCPAPLAGPEEIRGFAVTGEALTPEGSQRSPERGAEAFAELLARLVALAPDPASVPALTPSPPWNAWDHPGSRLWPDRDDYGRDINALPCPGWVDRAVAQVRQHLRACADPPRIGHGDWESQNIRWSGDTPLAVHDWDSVIAQPEVAIAGLASAVWPAAGGPGEAATVEQSADFLAKYQACAGRRWSARKIRDAWAAGLWVRLFNAKKDAASGGGPQLDRLADEIGERMARAGLPER